MALLLNIDTATSNASVCISNDAAILAIEKSADQKNHASFIQPAIKKIMSNAGISFNELDAIAVSAGPGSYTGLRVGLSTAKGLCYAAGKKLIMINTLEVMALAAKMATSDAENFLYCPMIDARRMEVFTAIYDHTLANILLPSSVIISEHSFGDMLAHKKMLFSGDGSHKFKQVAHPENAFFSDVIHDASQLAVLASAHFASNKIADIAYSEPFYLKEFFSK